MHDFSDGFSDYESRENDEYVKACADFMAGLMPEQLDALKRAMSLGGGRITLANVEAAGPDSGEIEAVREDDEISTGDNTPQSILKNRIADYL